jgi:hypothetical protein
MSESVVAQLDNMLQRLDVLRAQERDNEITRLRARVEELEKVRAAAQALDGYGFGWLHWDEKFETLRAALKEAKP